MKTTIVVLCALLLLAALVFFGMKKDMRVHAKKMQIVFEGRFPLSDQEFAQKYFETYDVPSDVPIKVRQILAEQFDVDMSRLAATDDFTKNLKFLLEWDDLVDVAIVEALEKEFGIAISDEQAKAMHSVQDIVLGVTKLLRGTI